MNLQNIVDNKSDLSEADIDALVALLTHKCRHATKKRVRSILTYSLHSLRGWYLERIYYRERDNVWCYVAGQDYVAELATIRRLIVGN